MTAASFAWSEAQADARAHSTRRDPLRLLSGSVALADMAVILAASGLAYALRYGLTPVPLEFVLTTVLAMLLTVNAAQLSGGYPKHVASALPAQVWRVVQVWSLVFVFLVMLAYATNVSNTYGRLWVGGWYLIALPGFILVRLAAFANLRKLRRSGRLAQMVAIVDLAGNGEALARRLRCVGHAEMRLVGVFAAEPSSRQASSLDDLIALSRLFRIDEVIVTVSGSVERDIGPIIRRLGTIPTNVRLCPELPALASTPVREAGMFLDTPILTVHQRPFAGWNAVAKRLEDLVLGSLMLVFLAPLMLVIAVAVKFSSPGPVLFRQKRLGFNNNVIVVYKFRSMTQAASASADVPQARRGDARITRLGHFLRRTSLDELPQLFNVARGEMSLIGPRPHALAHNEQYAALIDDYLSRHRVQPGITGWAQINGYRGETDTLDKMQRRVEYDLAYIDKWSILLDLKILFMTAVSVVAGRNAY